jgi:hypothetical protein
MESNYSDLDGSVELYDAVLADSPITKNYYDADNFYPASGLLKGTILDKKERARRRALREKRKDMKAEGKLAVAQSSKIAAQGLGKDSQADIELAKSLNAKPTGGTAKKGMSTTTKVLIGVGVLAVLVGGYFAYKKFSKGK